MNVLLTPATPVPLQHAKNQRHYFADKCPYSQSYGFSSSHEQMWELYHKEGWMLKNWCFWIVVLEQTLESPLNSKEIKPFHPKGNQFWLFIGRNDAEAEAPILRPPDAKSWLIGKDPNARKEWRQEEKGTTEEEMVGWHHLINGHELEQAPGDGEGQGSWLAAVHRVTKSCVQLSDRTTKSSTHYTDLTNQNTAMSGPWQLVGG